MFWGQPESSKSVARQGESENPMEDRSSFPGCGSGEADGLRVGRSEVGPKCLSSRCPCRLRSTQLQSVHARTLSLYSHKQSFKTQAKIRFLMLATMSSFLGERLQHCEWRTYTGVLEEAAVAPDTSSAAGRALDSPSEETSCFAGALSSAKSMKQKLFMEEK